MSHLPENKAAQLPPNERIVIIQLNEIDITTKVACENGKVCGHAENETFTEAYSLSVSLWHLYTMIIIMSYHLCHQKSKLIYYFDLSFV